MKTIVVGISGSIAAYKACELVRALKKKEYDVEVIMTNNATKFISPLTLGALINKPVLIDDFDDTIDYFVAGIGTGGTITGIARELKKKYPEIKIIGVEPSDSPLITKGKAGSHGIQGIGANFIPEILDLDLIDEVITVSTDEAYSAARLLAKKEGLLVGISAGAALHGASTLSGENKNVVVLLPDTGERYLSTALFE